MRSMKSTKISLFGLAATVCIIMLMSLPPAAATYSVASTSLTLSTSSSNTFQVGAINTLDDSYNVQARSGTEGEILALNGNFGQLSSTSITSLSTYPLNLGGPSSLSAWDPSARTRYFAVANNSASFGTYTFTSEKMMQEMLPGDTDTITINNTLNTLDLELNLQANTPYDLFITNQVGSFTTHIIATSTLDPANNSFTVSALQAYTAGTFFCVFVARVSGWHLIAYTLAAVGDTVVVFTLNEIPQTSITPNQVNQLGDSPFASQNAINAKTFSTKAFVVPVSIGDAFTYSMTQTNDGGYIFAAAPYPAGYLLVPYGYANTVARAATTSDIAQASGKVMLISIEVNYQNLVTYRVLIEDSPALSLSLPQSTTITVNPYSYSTFSVSIPQQEVIRLDVNKSLSSPAVVVWSTAYFQVQNSFLLPIGKSYFVSVANTTDVCDRMYFLPQGVVYFKVDNFANAEPAQITINVTVANNKINTSDLSSLWQDTFKNGAWVGFNDSTNFTTDTFNDLGKGDGAKTPNVYEFTISNLSFVQFRFQINASLNTGNFTDGDTFTGNLSISLLGPDDYYPTIPGMVSYTPTPSTAIFTVSTTAPKAGRTLQTPTMTTLMPGNYYLLIGMNSWQDTTHPSIYNGSVVLCFAVMSANNHYLIGSYKIGGAQPLFHAFSKAAGFRSVDYLNFATNFNTVADFPVSGQYLGFSAVQYNDGLLIQVTGAGAYNWTQLLAYFTNCDGLTGTPVNTTAESNNAGISIIYNPIWTPYNGIAYYNQKVYWQNGGGTGGYQGQSPPGGATTGEYSMEFGVYASSFLLWILPNTSAGTPNNITLGFQIAQYNTPTAVIVTSLPPVPVNYAPVIMGVVVIGAIAAVVAVFLVVVSKRSPTGLKDGLRRMAKRH